MLRPSPSPVMPPRSSTALAHDAVLSRAFRDRKLTISKQYAFSYYGEQYSTHALSQSLPTIPEPECSTELTSLPEVVVYSTTSRVEVEDSLASNNKALLKMSSSTEELLPSARDTSETRAYDQDKNASDRREEVSSRLDLNCMTYCVLGAEDPPSFLLSKKVISTPVGTGTSSSNNSFATMTTTSYPATSSENADIATLADIDCFRFCLSWLVDKFDDRLNERSAMQSLLRQTKEAAENLQDHLRSDAGDSRFKNARDPKTHGYLVAKKDFLEEMLLTITTKAEAMCAQHAAIRIIQNKAWRYIRAAKRRQRARGVLRKMAGEEEEALEELQSDSSEK